MDYQIQTQANSIQTDGSNLQITHIRPHQVLRISDRFEDEIKFFMPYEGLARGSTSVLESILLIKLMRIVDADYLFEFGTYKGLTTRLLLENLPDKCITDKRIFTLDLPSIDGVEFQADGLPLANEAIGFERKYNSSKDKNRVQQLLQDSLTLDEQQYKGKFQFIFIDGNHRVNYAKSDTEKSFVMLAKAPSCIVWHDYSNPEYPELSAYIDNLAKHKRIYHIEDTMLAFHLVGKEVPARSA